MKFGMPTLVECESISDCCRVANECGLDFVEINMSFPQYQPESLDICEVNSLREKYGLSYTIHADEGMNPFDFNMRVSNCYFEVMRDTIRTARKISASIINLHLMKGVYVTLPGKVILLSDVYFDEYLTRVKKFIKMCEDEIGVSGIKIAIENVDSNPFTASQIKALEYFLASPVFALTLDTGHEDCLDYKDTHVFMKYPEKKAHLHLHDSDGKKPHLALGDGRLDIVAKLGDFSGETCLIEVKTIAGLKASVEYLKNKGIM